MDKVLDVLLIIFCVLVAFAVWAITPKDFFIKKKKKQDEKEEVNDGTGKNKTT